MNENDNKEEMEVREKQELQGREGTRSGTYFRPAVDIFETDQNLMIKADIPGCNPDDVEVNLEDNRLTLTAPTGGMNDAGADRWEQVYGEYREGHFLREFRLGKSIDRNNITAEMNNGVLELTLPKAEQAKPKKIEVSTG